MGKTKDERYLLKLHDMALNSGDPMSSINRNDVGAAIGFSPKVVKTIVTLLGQANFIRKEDGDEISLTKQGIVLVEELKGSS